MQVQALQAGCVPGARLQPARQQRAALRSRASRAGRNGPSAVVPAAAARCRRRLPPPPRASPDPEAELALLERELGAGPSGQDQVAIGKAAAAATNRCPPCGWVGAVGVSAPSDPWLVYPACRRPAAFCCWPACLAARLPTAHAAAPPPAPPPCHPCSRFQQPVWRWEESGDAVRAYGAFFGLLALGLIPAVQVSLVVGRMSCLGGGHAPLLRAGSSRGSGPAAGPASPGPAGATLPPPLNVHLTPAAQESRYADLPYFLGLASLTIYVGAHRGLTARQRQQISLKEGLLAPVAASGARAVCDACPGGRVALALRPP